jgi:AP-1 complex subunit mu
MSGISAIYILDLKGKIIIQRKYREDIDDECYTEFTRKSIEMGDNLYPMFQDKNNNTYFHTRHNNLIILAISKGNVNSVLVFTYIYKIIDVLKEYLVNFEDESVRDNFVIIYELLDEMMDNG